MNREIWTGCYKKLWGKKIVKDAYAHPAKFFHNLIYRIIQEGLDRGWWDNNTTILDPFAGVGLGGIAATDLGVPWLGVELEQKFVDLAWKNFDLHLPRWLIEGKSLPNIIQGDSRNLLQLMEGIGGGSREANIAQLSFVTSPPYENMDPTRSHSQGKGRTDPNSYLYVPFAVRTFEEYEKRRKYGDSEGQISRNSEETYWSDIGTILEQMHSLLPKEGHVAWVVKPFVRKGQIVDLPQMTLDLMLVKGFTPVVWIDADFEGRKSFFRRLQESKGAPPINYETVLVVKG